MIERSCNTDSALQSLTAGGAVVKGRCGGEAAIRVGRIGSRQGEAQRPFDFLEGHVLASKRVAQQGNGSRSDVAISTSIACHVEKFDLIF